MKPHNSWKVLPHGKLEQLAERLWTVTGELKMPLGKTTRRMSVVQLSGNRLAIYSAIALDDTEMAKLESLGTPAYLIVPSGIHRIDAKPWEQRYPGLTVVAPKGACDRINEVVHIDATTVDLGDPNVRLVTVPGTNDRELAMIVGKTLIVNDLIFNLPKLPRVAQWLYTAMGFHPGEPSIPKLVARKLVTDKTAVHSQLQQWANAGFERLVVAHGKPIEHPRETLLKLAAA